jgi:DNA-binding SARP family transcriptional activator
MHHIVPWVVDIRLLGPFQLLDGAGRVVNVSGDQSRALLAFLALESPRSVSAERLREGLWAEKALASPETSLQVAMSRLRKSLGDDVVRTVPSGYRLELPAASLDVERFRRLVRRGRQLSTLGQPSSATESFRQALGQWRGRALEDLRRFEFAEESARFLEEERIGAVEDLMQAELDAGTHGQIIGELSGLVAALPLRERLWAQLMIALYRTGRQSDALRAYTRAKVILGEELGIEPSSLLTDLEEQILLHDPVLDHSPAVEDRDWIIETELATFSPGDIIVTEGATADVVYWIEQGEVEVFTNGEGGSELILARLGPGRYFGELAALLGSRRTASVRAATPTTVSVHTVESFRIRLGAERREDVTPDPPIEEVWSLLRRGENLRAYDLSSSMVDHGRGGAELRYLSVLSLARSGATTGAIQRHEALGLASLDPKSIAPKLAEDIAALAARLDKDMALLAGPNDSGWARRSAGRYQAAFERFRSPYLAVNAATMWLLAGDSERAVSAARQAGPFEPTSPSEEDRYWAAATEAEAALILGEIAHAEEAVANAGDLSVENWAARATTLRQLRVVCSTLDLDHSILRPIRNPSIVHFCGHRIAGPGSPGRFPVDQEGRVAEEVADNLERLEIGVGYGSLAAGADIIAAEKLLQRKAELQVVLPFDRDEFIRTSVAPAGEEWIRRFGSCLASAGGVRIAGTYQYPDEPSLFDFCARQAMGDAVVRARYLETNAHQIAVWDGLATGDAAGTAVDVAHWTATGRQSVLIHVSGPGVALSSAVTPRRQIRAIIFGDFAGFGRLTDSQVERFHTEVMPAIAEVLDKFSASFLSGNTWGDGLYMVFDEVAAAADFALTLQETMENTDFHHLGLQELRGLRVAGHAGPILEGWDPVAERRTFFGAEVTRASRIEARTPEGEVFVTHPFAALASLAPDPGFDCQYVGTLPVAKALGALPLFVLRRLR